MRAGRMPRAGAAGVVAVFAALLVACTATDAPATSAPTSGSSSTAIPAPTPSPLPSGTLVTGSFTDADGAVLGSVSATASGLELAFDIAGLTPDQRALELSAPFSRDPADPCADGPGFAFGTIESAPSLLFPLSFGHDDPSFMRELALTRPGDATPSGCLHTIVATAALTWAFPPLRPYLADLTDVGPAAGARGRPTTDGGRPVTYTVAAGDTLTQIGDRFGISSDDILYLNPRRVPSPDDPNVYDGEVLNLDLGDR